MNDLAPFILRERIRITCDLGSIPALTLGSIVRTTLAPTFYEVWFDGTIGPCVVAAKDLEATGEAPGPGTTTSTV